LFHPRRTVFYLMPPPLYGIPAFFQLGQSFPFCALLIVNLWITHPPFLISPYPGFPMVFPAPACCQMEESFFFHGAALPPSDGIHTSVTLDFFDPPPFLLGSGLLFPPYVPQNLCVGAFLHPPPTYVFIGVAKRFAPSRF